MTLTEFLLARFDEAEKMVLLGMDHAEFMGPRIVDGREFVRADFEAKRRIVEMLDVGGNWHDYNGNDWFTLSTLALPYADHPDYDEGWRP